MRNVTMGLVLSLSLAACGGATPEPEVARPTSSETTSNAATTAPTAGDTKSEAAKPALADLQKKAIAAYTEAVVTNDAKKLAAFYTDDAVVNMVGMPEVKGREAIEKMDAEWHAAFPHEKFGFTRVWMKNDVVITEWAAIAKHAGDWMGVKATNKPMSLMGLTISWTDESGKIKKQNTYVDTGSVMAQIGASKAKTRPALTAIPSMESWAAKGTPEEDKNVDVAKSVYGAMEKLATEKDKKKAEADMLAIVTDDMVYDGNTMPEAIKGKDKAKAGPLELAKAFPDLKMTVNNAWGFGDVAVVEYTMSGTQKGAFMGKPASKKALNVHGVDIFQVKDGKVAHLWTYENGMEMAMQLGWMKMPAAPAAKADAKGADAKGDKAAAPAKGDKAAAPAKGDKAAAPAKGDKAAAKK
jgi:steroid delta-isomerase-like uncharacterized protein